MTHSPEHAETPQPGRIHPDEYREMVAAGEDVVLVDVRTPAEVRHWSFPGALSIPIDELRGRVDELPVDRLIVTACHTGVRSSHAAFIICRSGRRASTMVGGEVAWRRDEPEPEPRRWWHRFRRPAGANG